MKKTMIAIVTTTSFLIAGFSMAQGDKESSLSQIKAVKVDMVQAITKAEENLGGKVIKIKYENEHGQSIYEMEVVTDKKNVDLKIDALTGEIIYQAEDQQD